MTVDALSMIDIFTFVNGKDAHMAKSGAATEVQSLDRCCPSVLSAPLDVANATELATGFSALSDPVRLRILSMLAAAADGEVCVCDFVGPLDRSQPTISHHLKILGDTGLVHSEKRGRWVWYSLNRDRLAALRGAIDT
jgi:ArsR family transcriptional regulator, arsenate/arsenite/antimonite-responsive transcriptional repressor